MTVQANRRSGGRILIDQLALHGVDTVFCVPGESYLAALDAFADHPAIKLIVCRQEGGAAIMADAYGKLTGKPGICFVTRGPGATNASSGVHIAFQDSTPMILFVGQVGREMRDREAFQEVDFTRMFAPLAKWVAEIQHPGRIPELVSRAFYTAAGGRPGPVVLSLPEDMLTELSEVGDARPYARTEIQPGKADLDALAARLAKAERPVAILGGGDWDRQASENFAAFARAQGIPVGTTFRAHDLIDNLDPCYGGHIGIGINPKWSARIKGSDLLLVAGSRLGEQSTGGYSLIDVPTPAQPMIHVYPDPEEIGRVYQPVQGIVASMRPFAAALKALPANAMPARQATMRAAHEDYLAFTKPLPGPGQVQMSEIVASLAKLLPADAILSNGAGNYSVWVHRFHRYRGFRTQLAPTSGSMGYGMPAAIAAKLVHPKRAVVAFAGDGCFMMTSQELATAVQYRLPIVTVVVNNGMYGTIRMHQEREHPGRYPGTALVNPDFAAYARAFGAHGATVEKTADFAPALAAALEAELPTVIELRVDPEAITPTATLSGLRAAALAKR
ncbi:MAG: thiamine pyrophosphate-binding protein [Alphaproteobacteria bacterium]|nr:thiamine pyrophosphate-binding protein [Alphaproteobacteria bacterium]